MSTAVVTGAGGFIGSHLTEALVRQGFETRAFVHYRSDGSWGWLDAAGPDVKESLTVIAGDIRDAGCVRKALAGSDIVFHLAALIGIPYSYQAAESYVDTNVKGTLNVLQAAREAAVAKVVHTSTSEVYGTASYVPIPETHPLQAQSPYAASKIGADMLALSFYRSFGTPVAVVRPFNTYGPRQSARAIIPTIITQIAAGRRAIRLGALSPTRDFSHVQDTASGFLAAARSDRAVGEVVNLGSDHEISIGETVRLIAGIMNADVEIVQEPERVRPENSEVQRLWADTTKAREILGWTPVHGRREGFRRGLADTVEWFSRGENLKHYKPRTYGI